MLVPDANTFGVQDIQNYVGSKRILDVMECVTQRAMEMTMRDFARYFEVGFAVYSARNTINRQSGTYIRRSSKKWDLIAF